MRALEREDVVLDIGDADIETLVRRQHVEVSVVSAVRAVEEDVVNELIKNGVKNGVEIFSKEQ